MKYVKKKKHIDMGMDKLVIVYICIFLKLDYFMDLINMMQVERWISSERFLLSKFFIEI